MSVNENELAFMEFKEDSEAFHPLETYLINAFIEHEGEVDEVEFINTIGQYMYMGNTINGLYYYKHFGDRSYLHIQYYPDGEAELIYGEVQDWREWE
jgi:hypothetical protein